MNVNIVVGKRGLGVKLRQVHLQRGYARVCSRNLFMRVNDWSGKYPKNHEQEHAQTHALLLRFTWVGSHEVIERTRC